MVQKRALRACEEQPDWEDCFFQFFHISNFLHLFRWSGTKEGEEYWVAVHRNHPNPDQYLPENYVDVDAKEEPDYEELLKQVVWKLHEAQTFKITIERDGRNATWEAEASMDGQFVETSDIIDIANWIEKEIS